MRFQGMLPRRLTRYRAPRWWQEIAILALAYWLYGLGRNAVPQTASVAQRHARGVQHLQEHLHLSVERTFNHFVASHEWIAQVMNYYYATLHFIVTVSVLVWLYFAHPRVFRGGRTVLFATTLLALAGFFLYPLAPPRLLPAHYGYIDTILKFHTWGSLADPDIAKHSNQYAAMPSLHIGWALWSALTVFQCARRTWVRWAALLYPAATLLVIIGTANHYVFDAIGGAATIALAFLIQWLLSGHGAYSPPPGAPGPVGQAEHRIPPPAPSHDQVAVGVRGHDQTGHDQPTPARTAHAQLARDQSRAAP